MDSGSGNGASQGNGKKRKPKARSPYRVKSVSRDAKFAKVKRLRCYEEVYSMILDGFPMSEVARVIQEDRKEYTDITRGSLITVLNDFRASIPKTELISRRMPKVMIDAKERVAEGLDELKEMEKLFLLQMDRIGIDAATEKKIRKLMPSMTQEIRTAREILANYADLKMDLGLATRHMGKLQVDGNFVAGVAGRYGSEAVEKVLADPESRRKVLGAAQRLLQLSADPSQQIIDVEAEPVDDADAEVEEEAVPVEGESGVVSDH
jgi:hypothetical protein